MKNPFSLILAAVLLLAVTGAAQAEAGYKDIVRSTNGNPVTTTTGGCVRTMWPSDTENCPSSEPSPMAPAISLEERTVYFALGKSKLSKDAKLKLDALAATLKSQPQIKNIRIAGFADRIGSAVKNEKLSKKRAEVVRKYLVSKGVVNAQLTETRWFGSSAPTTSCPKKLAHKKLVACLQQDRRVEVEVEYATPTPAPATESVE